MTGTRPTKTVYVVLRVEVGTVTGRICKRTYTTTSTLEGAKMIVEEATRNGITTEIQERVVADY